MVVECVMQVALLLRRNLDAVYVHNSGPHNGCDDTIKKPEVSLMNGQPILHGQENCTDKITIENTYL